MPPITLTITGAGQGMTLTGAVTRSGPGGSQIDQNPAEGNGLPVGFAGALTTRTSGSEGEVTLGEGHEITTGQVVDLYWAGGLRYAVTVGTVAGQAVPLTDSGAGDDLPDESTAVVVSPRLAIAEYIDGDTLLALVALFSYAAGGAGRCHVQFLDDSAVEVAAIEYAAGVPVPYDIAGGQANPWEGEQVLQLAASQSSTATEGRLRINWTQGTTVPA